MPDDWAGLAKAVRQARKERGITQKQLEAASNVGATTIKEIERGKRRRRYGRKMLEDISTALGLPRDHLANFLYTLSPPVNGSALEQAIRAAFGGRLETIDKIDTVVDLMHGLSDTVGDLAAQVRDLKERVADLADDRPASPGRGTAGLRGGVLEGVAHRGHDTVVE